MPTVLRNWLDSIDTFLRSQKAPIVPVKTETIDVMSLERRLLYSAVPLIEPPQDHASPQAVADTEALSSEALDFVNQDLSESKLLSEPSAELDLFQSGSDSGRVLDQLRRELVFIDSSVEDFEQLLTDVLTNTDSNRDLEVVLLGPDRDGIEHISQILAQRSGLDAIHIVSHGAEGRVQLGNTELNSTRLDGHAGQIASWSLALDAHADLLFYGCDLATGDGQLLLESIAELTGADVAASENITGQAALGGDWTLEFNSGSIETLLAFSVDAQSQWTGVLATYTVTNTNDSGAGSLRQAIANANSNAGFDTIEFNIAVNDPRHYYYRDNASTGTLSAPVFTDLTDAAITDFDADYHPGTARSWYSIALSGADLNITEGVLIDGTTQAGHDPSTGPIIELNASGVSSSDPNGLTLTTGASTIRGLIINRAGDDAIEIDVNAGGSTIVGNYLGTDVTGLVTNYGNRYGITIKSDSNQIGGTNFADRNIIGGNSTGADSFGIGFWQDADNNIVEGNYIGVGIDGTTAMGNRQGITFQNTTDNNRIGGLATNQANTIANNSVNGIDVIAGSGNSFLGNSIFGNGQLGINLGTAGSTPNDGDDIDSGANGLQNFPVLQMAVVSGSQVTVGGFLNSEANKVYRIEFFANSTNADEGQRFLGFTTVTTPSGSPYTTSFTATLNASVSEGEYITATATSPTNSTSEFSTAYRVRGTSGLWISGTNNSTAGGVSYDYNSVVQFGGPNLSFEPGTSSGSFYSPVFDLDNFGGGIGNLNGIHYVKRTVTVGSANAVTLQAGDVLFSLAQNDTVGGVAISSDDIALFRPMTAGDYRSGTISILLQNPMSGDETRDFALVETTTVVGGVTLNAGDFLLVASSSTYDKDITRYQVSDVGPGTTSGTRTELIDGDSTGIGFGAKIFGLELVQSNIFLGGSSLTAGQLLISLDSSDTVGVNNLNVDKYDIFTLTVTATGTSTSSGTATLLLQGLDIGLTAGGEEYDAIALLHSNDAPVLDSSKTPILNSLSEDAGAPSGAVGTLISQLVDFAIPSGQLDNVTDANSGDGIGVAITAADSSLGTWHYSTNNGASWSLLGAVSESAAKLLAADTATRIYFQPNANYNGTLPTALTFRAWDRTSGVNGANANTINNGGETAFSAATDTASLTVLAINDQPVFTSLNGTPTFVEGGAAVVLDSDVTIYDAELSALDNFNGATLTLVRNGGAISQDVFSSTGSLSALIQGGDLLVGSTIVGSVTTNGSGTLVLTFNSNATNALVNSVVQQIAYSNNSENPPTSAQINWTFNDGNSGTQGSGGASSGNGSTIVYLTSVNDEQTIATNTGRTVAENSTGNSINNTQLRATDLDNTASQLVYTVTGTTSNGTLRRNGAALSANSTFTQADIDSGLISYDHNGSETSSDSFSFSVDDGTGSASSGTFNFTISLVNDNSPTITSNGGGLTAAINVVENSTAVTTVVAIDNDLPSQPLTYSINGADAGLFTIDSNTGVLVFISGRDRESHTDADANGIYELTVEVTDGTFADSQDISITITDANEFAVSIPTDIDSAANTVNENVGVGWTVGITANAFDLDATNNSITYSLTSNPDGLFQIDFNTGVVTTAAAINREIHGASQLITVQATSSDGSISSQNFTITINDVNEFVVSVPSDSDTTANVVNENSAVGTNVGLTANAFDLDSTNNTITYSLTSNPDGLFQIDVNTGIVTTTVAIDRETHGASRNIAVQATSNDGSIATQNFTITINDLDEFTVGIVTDTDAGANLVAEDATVGTVVGVTGFAEDLDATNNTITYTLDDNAGGRFSVDANSGVVTVAGALDYESNISHSITIRATSTDGSSATQAFVISVTNVNDGNVGPISDVNTNTNSVAENSVTGTPVGVTAQATDPDATDSVTYSLDDSAGGRFAIDSTTGAVTTAGAIDREVAGSYNITIRATSSDGTFSTLTLAITIADVNEFSIGPISDTDLASNSVNENSSIGSLVGVTAQATDNDATNNTVSYSLVDDDGGRFAIDANSGLLTVASAIDREIHGPSRSITVRAISADGSFVDQTLVITINDVDEFDVSLPADTDTFTNLVLENAAIGTAVGIDVDAFDGDATMQAVVYSLANDDGGRFAIDAVSGIVTVAGVIDRELDGPARTIVVRADSADGSFSMASYQISVDGLNDHSPVIISDGGSDFGFISVSENNTEVTGVVATDGDLPGQPLTYSISGGADASRFTIDALTGALQLRQAADYESPSDADRDNTYEVIVRVEDSDGLSDTQALFVSITNANEGPVAVADSYSGTASQKLTRSATEGLLINDVDVDGNPLTAVLVSGPANGTLLLNADGSFEFTPDAGFNRNTTFRYYVSDGTVNSTPTDVTLSITPIAPPPPDSSDSTEEDQDDNEDSESESSETNTQFQGPGLPLSRGPSEQNKANAVNGQDSIVVEGAIDGHSSTVLGAPQLVTLISDTLSTGSDESQPRHFVVASNSSKRSINQRDLGLDRDNELSAAQFEFILQSFAEENLLREQSVQLVSGLATALFIGAATGGAFWLAGGSYLAATLYSSLPVWARFDPIFVLQNNRGAKIDDDMTLTELINNESVKNEKIDERQEAKS